MTRKYCPQCDEPMACQENDHDTGIQEAWICETCGGVFTVENGDLDEDFEE